MDLAGTSQSYKSFAPGDLDVSGLSGLTYTCRRIIFSICVAPTIESYANMYNIGSVKAATSSD